MRGKIHTSFSPTITTTARPPFGTICANSPNFTVSLLPLTKCTRSDSRVSGLKRPPALSFERASLSRSIAFWIPASSVETSYGSLFVAVASMVVANASTLRLLFSLPPFLRLEGVVVKVCRWMRGWICWVEGWWDARGRMHGLWLGVKNVHSNKAVGAMGRNAKKEFCHNSLLMAAACNAVSPCGIASVHLWSFTTNFHAGPGGSVEPIFRSALAYGSFR